LFSGLLNPVFSGLYHTLVTENLQKLSYRYDNVGNITSLTDAVNGNQVQTFAYDWLDRLAEPARIMNPGCRVGRG